MHVLRAYAGRPDEAVNSLNLLLDVAMCIVLKVLCCYVPIIVKATTGLHLLGGHSPPRFLMPCGGT
jgi:Golgi nucleoside diphosphatase